jgi:hypothetical protein
MTGTAWVELPKADELAVWGDIRSRLGFRPSIYESDWPGIYEPPPFETYSIADIYNSPDAHALEADLELNAARALRECIDSTSCIYALDWQHVCYWMYPGRLVAGEPWRIPALPSGDYYIFLSKKLDIGWFGHPWEKTICVFGHDLVSAINKHRPRLFAEPIRAAT